MHFLGMWFCGQQRALLPSESLPGLEVEGLEWAAPVAPCIYPADSGPAGTVRHGTLCPVFKEHFLSVKEKRFYRHVPGIEAALSVCHQRAERNLAD